MNQKRKVAKDTRCRSKVRLRDLRTHETSGAFGLLFSLLSLSMRSLCRLLESSQLLVNYELVKLKNTFS